MRKSKPALFSIWLVDNGKRRRATQAELRECWRLWCKHADIRLGRAQ